MLLVAAAVHLATPECAHPDAAWDDHGCTVPTVDDLTVDDLTVLEPVR